MSSGVCSFVGGTTHWNDESKAITPSVSSGWSKPAASMAASRAIAILVAPGVPEPPPLTMSMLPERSMTRNSARLPCCGSIGGVAETGSMSSSTLPW